jgi:hypothetical protein
MNAHMNTPDLPRWKRKKRRTEKQKLCFECSAILRKNIHSQVNDIHVFGHVTWQ